jgi:S-DNA-T family DNA segregation ATPase FtsK/SpoIIIE
MSDAATRPVAVLPWTVPVVHAAEAPRPRPPDARQESTLDLAVRRMSGRRPRAHQVWLPPLDRPDTLDALMPDLAVDPALGLVSHGWRERGPLTIPLGTVDRPREQRRDTLTADLSGALGHCAVVGAPRTGKSTLLRTLVTAVALTTTPLESQFFVLDLGGTFAGLRALPHVAGAAGRAEPDVVRRIVAEATGVVDRRESYFERHGIDAMETYRSLRAEGRADDGYGDVFVVVDGWGALRVDFDGVEVELQHLAARGLGHGLHLVASTTRWADFRSPTRDLFGTRLELRLGDPLDSGVDRRTAAQVPSGRPGRGLLADGQHFLSALPRIDAGADPATLTAGVEALVGAVADAWPGPLPPKLRMLPELVAGAEVVAGAGPEAAARRLLLGVDEKALAPVWVDPADEPHLLVFGDRQSGKTAALRGYLHEVMRIRTPGQAQLVVVDYRRSLLGEVPEEYLLHYLTSGAQAAPALAGLASFLESRLPGDDVTPEQLRHRSWWSGAEAFVVVDDYDLVATSTGSPLQPLVPLLAQARDVGLHVAVARRAGGASRALYEPVIQTLRDLAMPGVVLSGSPDEGPLIGNVRPGPAPPGRGRLVTRDREGDVVQLAWRAPAPDT